MNRLKILAKPRLALRVLVYNNQNGRFQFTWRVGDEALVFELIDKNQLLDASEKEGIIKIVKRSASPSYKKEDFFINFRKQ